MTGLDDERGILQT